MLVIFLLSSKCEKMSFFLGYPLIDKLMLIDRYCTLTINYTDQCSTFACSIAQFTKSVPKSVISAARILCAVESAHSLDSEELKRYRHHSADLQPYYFKAIRQWWMVILGQMRSVCRQFTFAKTRWTQLKVYYSSKNGGKMLFKWHSSHFPCA